MNVKASPSEVSQKGPRHLFNLPNFLHCIYISYYAPLYFSLKFLVLFWVTFCCFNTFFYASLIKASLTFPGMQSPITSLKEIVESGLPYKLFNRDPIEEASWRKSLNPLIRQI
jgi:hypothetical protein